MSGNFSQKRARDEDAGVEYVKRTKISAIQQNKNRLYKSLDEGSIDFLATAEFITANGLSSPNPISAWTLIDTLPTDVFQDKRNCAVLLAYVLPKKHASQPKTIQRLSIYFSATRQKLLASGSLATLLRLGRSISDHITHKELKTIAVKELREAVINASKASSTDLSNLTDEQAASLLTLIETLGSTKEFIGYEKLIARLEDEDSDGSTDLEGEVEFNPFSEARPFSPTFPDNLVLPFSTSPTAGLGMSPLLSTRTKIHPFIYLEESGVVLDMDELKASDSKINSDIVLNFFNMLGEQYLTDELSDIIETKASLMADSDSEESKKIIHLLRDGIESNLNEHLKSMHTQSEKCTTDLLKSDPDAYRAELKRLLSIIFVMLQENEISECTNLTIRYRKRDRLMAFMEAHVLPKYHDSFIGEDADLYALGYQALLLLAAEKAVPTDKHGSIDTHLLNIQNMAESSIEGTIPEGSSLPVLKDQFDQNKRDANATPPPSNFKFIIPNSVVRAHVDPYYNESDINIVLEADILARHGGFLDASKKFILSDTVGTPGKPTTFKAVLPAVDSQAETGRITGNRRTLAHAAHNYRITFDYFLDRDQQFAPDPGKPDDRMDLFQEMEEVGFFAKENADLNAVMAYNLTEFHWIATDIRIIKRDKNFHITVRNFDPMYGSAMDDTRYGLLISACEKRIKAIVPDAVITNEKLPSYDCRIQSDLNSCGAYTAHIMKTILNNDNPEALSPIGGGELRLAQYNAVKASTLHTGDKRTFCKRNGPRLRARGIIVPYQEDVASFSSSPSTSPSQSTTPVATITASETPGASAGAGHDTTSPSAS